LQRSFTIINNGSFVKAVDRSAIVGRPALPGGFVTLMLSRPALPGGFVTLMLSRPALHRGFNVDVVSAGILLRLLTLQISGMTGTITQQLRLKHRCVDQKARSGSTGTSTEKGYNTGKQRKGKT
jgi:hypothetical protein